MTTHSPELLLVGAGYMAREYAKVLKGLRIPFIAVGRGEANAAAFKRETGHAIHTGGIANWLAKKRTAPRYAIVAVNMTEASTVTSLLDKKGAKEILVEKPGGKNANEIHKLSKICKAKVFVAYNRRFYTSTRHARELINADGGVLSFHFDFTEVKHIVEASPRSLIVKRNWFLGNSTHVVDLAFFLGGKPTELTTQRTGSLPWHPSGAEFTGCGKTEQGAIFSYHANWDSPGRWGLEVQTKNYKFIFRPLEKLHIQRLKSFVIEELPIPDELDKKFKPGLCRLVDSFLSDKTDLPTLAEQAAMTDTYTAISGEKQPS